MQLIAIVVLAVVFGWYYRVWISPILKQRWSFYPQEIYWAVFYLLAISSTYIFTKGFGWVVFTFNLFAVMVSGFVFRRLTWLEIQGEKDNDER